MAQSTLAGEGMGGDEGIKGPDGSAFSFELGADAAIAGGGGIVKGYDQ